MNKLNSVLLTLFVLILCCCREASKSQLIATDTALLGQEKLERRSPPSAPILVQTYPPGRWRLATPRELDQRMLWVSHIRIAHGGVQPGVASFTPPLWTHSQVFPERTRLEALRLAETVRARAARAPADFAKLARELSEDPGTRDSGGSLGGVTAFQLAQWPEVLDAWEALQANEVSRVVETEFGFHVFWRRPPPPERRLSGAHIVIGHDQAPWLHRYLGRRPIPSRSRAEALLLAQRVYEELRRHPQALARLVEEYSDHRDAAVGGDLGEWSTREPTERWRELEVLQGLNVGDVARPIDSPFGVQVIVRTPRRVRIHFAAEVITRSFDPSLPGQESELRASVFRDLQVLRADSTRFAQVRGTDCCAGIHEWLEGNGDALEQASLVPLQLGQVAPEPIFDVGNARILRRVAPASSIPAPVRVDLSRPAAADIDYFLAYHGRPAVLTEVAARTVSALPLEPATETRLQQLSNAGAWIWQHDTVEEDLIALRDFQRNVRELLGPDRYREYERILTAYVEERLLTPRPDALFRDTETGTPYAGWPLL